MHCGKKYDAYSNAQKYCSQQDNPECESDRYFAKMWDKGTHPLQHLR